MNGTKIRIFLIIENMKYLLVKQKNYKKNKYSEEKFNEQRYISVGKVFSSIITVVYTYRGFVIRIISARPASKKERKLYKTQ